jgi:hypothetical protein
VFSRTQAKNWSSATPSIGGTICRPARYARCGVRVTTLSPSRAQRFSTLAAAATPFA